MASTPDMILKKLARAAILKVGGDTEKARDEFNNKIMEANRADLERELCSVYRNTAIRAVLATHYQELRSEGKLPLLREPTWIPTTDHEKTATKPRRPSDWMWDDEIGMTPKAHIRRYLETFMVNGKPIGDCRVEEVDMAAGVKESDARFMRALVQGLPPTVIVREHRTEEDAAKLWDIEHAIKECSLRGSPAGGLLEGITQTRIRRIKSASASQNPVSRWDGPPTSATGTPKGREL